MHKLNKDYPMGIGLKDFLNSRGDARCFGLTSTDFSEPICDYAINLRSYRDEILNNA